MQTTLTIQVVIWIAMATVVGGLALYRKFISRSEVDVIHLRDNELAAVSEQDNLAHRLEKVDRWGKLLTIVLIVYGLLIACGWLVYAWKESVQPTT
jgi:putative heme iron utilization protein